MSGLSVCLSRFLFNLGLVSGLLLTWIWARLALLLTWPCQQGGLRSCVYSTTWTMLNLLWRLPFCFSCCFISVKNEKGVEEMRQALAAKKGKPRIVLQNHTSFLDAVMGTQLLGCSNVRDCKVMASEHLFKMPLLGPVCVACGHLCVPFKSQETKAAEPSNDGAGKKDGDGIERKGSIADFSVDKDAIKKVMEIFQEHVQNGGIGTWYPEGRLNPDPEAGLQQFRAGGFMLVVNVDCEIWCMCSKNNQVCWPRKAALGGMPADIYNNCFKLCSSSHEFVKHVQGDDRAKALYIADQAHAKMTEALSALGGAADLKEPLLEKAA